MKMTVCRPSPFRWGLGLGTTYPIATRHQKITPENFARFSSSVQKLFMIFQNTDGQTHKRITPLPHWVQVKFLYPVFLPFHSLRLLASLSLSI